MESFSNGEQRAYLRSCLSSKVIQTLELLLDVKDDEPVASVLDSLEKYYGSIVNLMTRRFHFQRCVQKPGERFSDFLIRLKILGDNSELDALSYEDRLAGHIVCSVHDKLLQTELLKMDNHDLLSVKSKCMAWEAAADNQKALEYNVVTAHTSTQKPTDQGASKSRQMVEVPSNSCHWCGNPKRHARQVCPARSARCLVCNRMGHFDKVCFTKERSTAPVTEESEDEAINRHNGKSIDSTVSTNVINIR